jgi:hypothetical protein
MQAAKVRPHARKALAAGVSLGQHSLALWQDLGGYHVGFQAN